MAYWFSKRTACGTVTHLAETWDDVGWWDYQFNFSCYDMAAHTDSYLRNVCLAMRLVVEEIDKLKATEPSEVDMSAILKAMDEAQPHQPLLFVGYLEAYYASVWNATFDERTFAELVKRWSIWG